MHASGSVLGEAVGLGFLRLSGAAGVFAPPGLEGKNLWICWANEGNHAPCWRSPSAPVPLPVGSGPLLSHRRTSGNRALGRLQASRDGRGSGTSSALLDSLLAFGTS